VLFVATATNRKINTTLPDPEATKHILAAAVNLTTTTLNSTTPICTLSPHARALSSVLTGFVGAILTGLSSGAQVAFQVAWVCWFAALRNLLITFYQLYSLIHLELPEGDEHFFAFMDWLVVSHSLRDFNKTLTLHRRPDSPVTLLGWAGWAFTTLYSPVVQVLWLVENWHQASSGLKWARAIGVGVAALPSGFDSRARYGRALGALCGWEPAGLVFGVLTAASTLTLSGVAVVELGLAAKQAGRLGWLGVLYVFFTVVWTHFSLQVASPRDGSKDMTKWMSLLGGSAMGAFGGVFVALPAFLIMLTAEKQPGVGLSEYLQCEGVAWWRKMVAILP
jgi:hypothetical protein